MPLPYQGNPGVFNYNGNPTLIPNFYPNQMGATGNMDVVIPATAGATRVNATAAVTVGGTVAGGETPSITLTQPQLPNGAITATYTVLSTDSVQDVAANLAAVFNAAAEASNIAGIVWATTGTDTQAHEAVITFHWSGPTGNSGVLTTGGTLASITLTRAPSNGAMSGGSGPVFAFNNFTFQYNNIVKAFVAGKPEFLDAFFIAALVAADMPIV